jgi:hypothetical protein
MVRSPVVICAWAAGGERRQSKAKKNIAQVLGRLSQNLMWVVMGLLRRSKQLVYSYTIAFERKAGDFINGSNCICA